MLKLLTQTFSFNNAYYANTLIYRLKHFPIIKNILPADLYSNRGLKLFANILGVILKIGYSLSAKMLYVLLFLYLPLTIYRDSAFFFPMFFFLTVIGMISNGEILNPTKEKYYSVILLRVDARKYALASYLLFLIKNTILLFPFLLIFGLMAGVSLPLLLLSPVLWMAMKVVGAFGLIWYYDKTGKLLSENNVKLVMTVSVIGLLLAYGLPYLGVVFPSFVFYIVLGFFVLGGIFAFRYLVQYQGYKKLYKQILTLNAILFNIEDAKLKAQKTQMASQLTVDIQAVEGKKGYAYFNEIFKQRHYKILLNSARKFALVYLAIVGVVLFVIPFSAEFAGRVNRILMTSLPYFVFIMYLTNRGGVVTQAMFVNCDHSMLVYRFYRQPRVILELFKERLWMLIKINMIPTLVIALGLPFILAVSGGTENPVNYFVLFLSIVALSVFFSVHYLILYYLLQPYDIQMKAKSTMYSLISGITYFVCYMCIRFQAPTLVFASSVIFFCLVYVVLSLYLVYRYAPKTFHLK